MHNFRKYPAHTRASTVDGIINSRHQQVGSIDFRRPTQHPAQIKIDNFRRPEGFHAGVRPNLSAPRNPAISLPPIDDTMVLPDAPPKRHHKKKRNIRKTALRSVIMLLLVGFITGGYIFGKGYLKARQIFKGGAEGAAALQENVDPSLLKGEGDGRVNILVLGKGGPGHIGADLTDTVIVASIDPLQKEASLLSIPRDLYVKVTDLGSMKINSVYANAKQNALTGSRVSNDQLKKAEEAGLSTIQKTVEQSMGIPIHYYAMIDFEGFRKAIDTVGGIDIDVQQELYDPSVAWENGYNPLIAAKGMQHFNGKKALLYSRSRYGSARGDFDRAQRQREVILALKEKVLNVGTFGNPLKISQLTDDFGNHVQTNLSVNEVMRLYTIGKDVPSNKVASLGLADPPHNYVTTANIGGQSVVIPRAGAGNFKEIQSFVRNSLKDGFIRNENASLVILNGTNIAGLAGKRSEELKSFGYNVNQVGDAPTKDYANTILVDLRKNEKKYTRRYLEQRLNVTAVENLPDGSIQPGTADFVIILGRNETNTPAL